MAVKSVTNANVAEYVAERKGLGHTVLSPEQVAQLEVKPKVEETKETKGPVVGTTTETVSTSPPPADAKALEAQAEKKERKNSVQERIDELTREKRELEEFAEGEYHGRVQAQRRIDELQSQIQTLEKKEQPKQEERKPRPDRKSYTDQDQYESDLLAWNREQAILDFRKEEEERRKKEDMERLIAEANARRDASLAEARKAFPDFDEKIKDAAKSAEMQRIPAPSKQVEGLLWESDYHAHILYYFATHPEEVKRINALRPAQAALAIGRLETQFAKGESAKADTTSTVTHSGASPPSKAPPPMPSLTGVSTETTWEPSKPQDFKQYKQRRLDEIRRARSRH